MTEVHYSIPAVIHIFHNRDFLENNIAYPHTHQAISSWKVHLPECVLHLWHDEMPEFQEMLESSHYLRVCYRYKLWTQVSDYVRAWALYHHGGIYLDTDMVLIRHCEHMRLEEFFTFSVKYCKPRLRRYANVEPREDINLEPAFMGSVVGHPILKEVLDIYHQDELFHSPVWIANDVFLAAVLRATSQEDNALTPTGCLHKKWQCRPGSLIAYSCASSKILSQGKSYSSLGSHCRYKIYSPESLIQCNQDGERKILREDCYAWHTCHHAWGKFTSMAFITFKHYPPFILRLIMPIAVFSEKIYNQLRALKRAAERLF